MSYQLVNIQQLRAPQICKLAQPSLRVLALPAEGIVGQDGEGSAAVMSQLPNPQRKQWQWINSMSLESLMPVDMTVLLCRVSVLNQLLYMSFLTFRELLLLLVS